MLLVIHYICGQLLPQIDGKNPIDLTFKVEFTCFNSFFNTKCYQTISSVPYLSVTKVARKGLVPKLLFDMAWIRKKWWLLRLRRILLERQNHMFLELIIYNNMLLTLTIHLGYWKFHLNSCVYFFLLQMSGNCLLLWQADVIVKSADPLAMFTNVKARSSTGGVL